LTLVRNLHFDGRRSCGEVSAVAALQDAVAALSQFLTSPQGTPSRVRSNSATRRASSSRGPATRSFARIANLRQISWQYLFIARNIGEQLGYRHPSRTRSRFEQSRGFLIDFYLAQLHVHVAS
jgi:hypothetical protein